ncbi:hypothetical protein Esti_003330 [Eimeria stiedai]
MAPASPHLRWCGGPTLVASAVFALALCLRARGWTAAWASLLFFLSLCCRVASLRSAAALYLEPLQQLQQQQQQQGASPGAPVFPSISSSSSDWGVSAAFVLRPLRLPFNPLPQLLLCCWLTAAAAAAAAAAVAAACGVSVPLPALLLAASHAVCCTYRFAAKQQHVLLLSRPFPSPSMALHAASALVELLVSLTVAAATWLLLLLSAATAVMTQHLLLLLEAFFKQHQKRGLVAAPVAAVLHALQHPLQQLLLLPSSAAASPPLFSGSIASHLRFWVSFIAVLWMVSVLLQRHAAEAHSRPARDAAGAAAVLLQLNTDSWASAAADVKSLALLGLRQCVSSLQLSVDESTHRYVQQQQQQQAVDPYKHGSSSSSSRVSSSCGLPLGLAAAAAAAACMQHAHFDFPLTLARLRSLELSDLLLKQQRDELPVFEALASLVLEQLRLQCALLRLLPTVASPAARKLQSLQRDSKSWAEAEAEAADAASRGLAAGGSSSSLFGSQWQAAAAAQLAALQQLLLERGSPESAVAAAVATAATAAEALTGWLCVLNALGKGFGLVGAGVAVRLSRELALACLQQEASLSSACSPILAQVLREANGMLAGWSELN